VDNRKESPAEHTWSVLILADYFLTKYPKENLDRLKVYELLMYHDVVEIEVGDTPLHPKYEKVEQKEKEMQAAFSLANKIPQTLTKKYSTLFHEFEAGLTKEAKFAKAVEELDSTLHEMDYKSDWKGWSEEFLRKHKEGYVQEFPELEQFFEEIIVYCNKNGFFNQ
jgi:putative hydrolase of HD superfamily